MRGGALLEFVLMGSSDTPNEEVDDEVNNLQENVFRSKRRNTMVAGSTPSISLVTVVVFLKNVFVLFDVAPEFCLTLCCLIGCHLDPLP